MKDVSSVELYSMLGVLEKSLSRPEEKDMLKEMSGRLLAYARIDTSPLPVGENLDGMTPHEKHTQQLKNAVQFFTKVSHTLNNRNLLEWGEPFEKVADGLGAAIDTKDKRASKLLAILCEVFAAGGVRFNPHALPDDVEEGVIATLKARGVIPRN